MISELFVPVSIAGTVAQGVVLGLSITAPVGPTNIEVIRRGTKEGWRAAATFCLGVMVALMLYLVIVGLGLSFLIESTLFGTLLTVSGVLVLAYLAYTSIREFFAGTEVVLEGEVSSSQHFVPGIVLTISNPAVLLLWTGIMGADLAASHASVGQGLALSLGILIGVTIFFTMLIFVIHFGRRFVQPRYLRYVSLIAGIVLSFFCVKFALSLIESLL